MVCVCYTDPTVLLVIILSLNTSLVRFAIPQALQAIRNLSKLTGYAFFESNGRLTTKLLPNTSNNLG